MKWVIGLVTLMVIGITATSTLVADFKSSFLVDGYKYSSLSYMSDDRDDNWRAEYRSIVLAHGDTHSDVLARNTDAVWGVVDGVGPGWGARLDTLNDAGLSPVVWMRGDDSPAIDKLGLGNQLDYNDRVVAASDDKVSHYVACLECNEYYSAQAVNVILQRLRQKTNKPIGVHLTKSMRGKEAYVQNADIIYLQTGFNLTEAKFREEIEYALTLGKPVVVSEYSDDNLSAKAKRYGDIACEYKGVVGTGNGRGASVCETLVWELEKDEKFQDKYDDEIAVFMLALVWLSVTHAINMPFTAKFNYIENENYEVIMAAPVSETMDAGMTYRDDGRVMSFVRGTFDKIFSGKTLERNSERR